MAARPRPCTMSICSWPIEESRLNPLSDWLADQAREQGFQWLLAHADDGVVWGKMRDSRLWTSSTAFSEVSPPLSDLTLQQARLFGPDAELLLWRTDDGWRARIIREGAGEERECYDELYLLWGDHISERQDGFIVLEHSEGLRHAPPVAADEEPPFALRVRHYLGYDDDGQAHVLFSRLVALMKYSAHAGNAERSGAR